MEAAEQWHLLLLPSFTLCPGCMNFGSSVLYLFQNLANEVKVGLDLASAVVDWMVLRIVKVPQLLMSNIIY